MSRPSRKPLDKDLYADVVAEAKSRFDVWPSAYASGWVVKTYKARGGRYAGATKGQRTGLTKWFGESWVDLSRPIHDEDGELVGYEPCGRKTAQDASNDPAAYPKCRPLAEAMRMSPSEVKDAIKRKRAAEAKAARGGRGGRGARAPVRVSTYRANPMREPTDAPGFRIAVIEHQKPGAFKGRIILVAYTDDGQMLAWIAALPASLRSETSTSSGPRAAAFPELRGYNDDAVVWEVAKSHAWVDGWGPLLYEALLAFVASKGYSGWVTSDAGMTSKEARAVWRRFSERDDVEFQHDVGKNVNGQPIDAMRALPALLSKRAPLLKKLDRRAAYTRAVKQFLRGSADQSSGRFVPLESEARANPDADAAARLGPVVDAEEWDDGTVVEFVAVPFPYERKPLGYKDDPKVQGRVNLATLIATQPRVAKAGVEKYLDDIAGRAGRAEKIRVYQTQDGRQYIADGHHRAVAAWAAGVEVLPAVIQLVRENPTADLRSNPRPDGDALTAWCASNESYAVLDETASAGSSWMAGACVLLAKAIRKRYPEAKLVGIETDHGIQHVGARIGDTVYDALGEHDPHAWARDWLAYEQLPARTLVRVVSLKGTPRSAFPDAESPATPADVALVARALP